MNATEDGLEPVGEHIDPFEAIQRGAVNNILSAADEVLATKQLAQRQAFALNKVRQLHRPGRTWPARIHLGLFATRQEAVAARVAAELRYFGEECPR